MGRLLYSGYLGIILLLIAGCGSQQVHFSRQAGDYPGYQTVYLEPRDPDPLQLNGTIRESLEEQGYRVVRQAPEDPDDQVFILLYDYATGPDLDESGRRSLRLEHFRMRLLDNARDKSEVAAGELSRGMLGQSPQDDVADLVTTLAEGLQNGRESGKRAEENTASESGDSLSSKEREPDENTPSLEEEEPKRDFSSSEEKEPENEERRNPWIPRLESWGFEDWGSDN